MVWSIIAGGGAVLFRQEVLEGIADGSVTLAFRRWKRCGVRRGSRLRTF
jgi:hypothetical protein